MYATVFKEDPLDPERGKQYRDKILRVGGSREELDSLKVSLNIYCGDPILLKQKCANRISLEESLTARRF